MAPDPTRVLARHFALDIAGSQAGFVQQVSGGGAHTNVIDSVGANALKSIGTVKYNDIVLTVGAGSSASLYQRIADAVNAKSGFFDGAIQFCDAGYKVISRLDWSSGIISAINFPALDVTSKNRAAMTVKIAADRNELSNPSGDKLTAIDTLKPWTANSFRFEIDGLGSACKKVSRIETLTLLQSISRGVIGSGRTTVIGPIAKRTLGDLVITLPEHAAKPFYDWSDSTSESDKFADLERTGVLTFLAPNLVSEYFTLDFKGLGLKSITRASSGVDSGFSPVTVEMYAESIQFNWAR